MFGRWLLQAQRGFEIVDVVALFPVELVQLTAKVTIVGTLLVDRTLEVEMLANALGGQRPEFLKQNQRFCEIEN